LFLKPRASHGDAKKNYQHLRASFVSRPLAQNKAIPNIGVVVYFSKISQNLFKNKKNFYFFSMLKIFYKIIPCKITIHSDSKQSNTHI
jgi:hypothetical protein